MGYLLTANVRGGRWTYSKSVAYNNAAAAPRDTLRCVGGFVGRISMW